MQGYPLGRDDADRTKFASARNGAGEFGDSSPYGSGHVLANLPEGIFARAAVTSALARSMIVVTSVGALAATSRRQNNVGTRR